MAQFPGKTAVQSQISLTACSQGILRPRRRFGRRVKTRERCELWIEVDLYFGAHGVKRRSALIDTGCEVFAVARTCQFSWGSLQKARRPLALSAVGSQPVPGLILGARVDVTLPSPGTTTMCVHKGMGLLSGYYP